MVGPITLTHPCDCHNMQPHKILTRGKIWAGSFWLILFLSFYPFLWRVQKFSHSPTKELSSWGIISFATKFCLPNLGKASLQPSRCSSKDTWHALTCILRFVGTFYPIKIHFIFFYHLFVWFCCVIVTLVVSVCAKEVSRKRRRR